MRTTLRTAAVAAALLSAAGCNDTIIIGEDLGAPRDLLASYTWVLEDFNAGQSRGYPAVDLTWLPPTDWSNEVFRVYGRRTGSASFALIATVTSCTTQGCSYRDRNVVSGETYEYYVATTDESTDTEQVSEFRETVAVPAFTRPAAPTADSVTGLDDATYVRWSFSGNEESLSRYIVYLTRIGTQGYLYHMGETDGNGFVDERADNGFVYGYRIAAVDTLGHVSNLSNEITGVPRPDATAELVYSFSSLAAESGFRFQTSEATSPIVSGSSAQAHWRLETTAGGWQIVPLNGTRVAEFPGRTTALVCGPGADAGCRAATRAPATGYQTTPIEVTPEFSYVFQVTGNDGQPHYGVVRVTLLGSDQTDRDLMIFDWAYQNVANEPRLNRLGS